MKQTAINRMILVLFSLLTLNAYAGLSEDYHQLKNTGRDFSVVGTICEQVAQLRFAERYPEPEFRVLTGIAYSDKDRTLGELDLIVFDNRNDQAVVIGEVKCWKNAKDGLKKAREQRQRFQTNVRSNKALTFRYLDNPSERFTKTQFNKTDEFISISQKGTMAAGFDYEMDYTLQELMQLRADIMACQNSGECQRPE